MVSGEAFCWEARWEVVSEAVTGEIAAEGVLMEEEEATAEEEEEETKTPINLAIFSSPFPLSSSKTSPRSSQTALGFGTRFALYFY